MDISKIESNNSSKSTIQEEISKLTNHYIINNKHKSQHNNIEKFIINWFKLNYQLTNNKTDILNVNDVYKKFKTSDYNNNFPKN